MKQKKINLFHRNFLSFVQKYQLLNEQKKILLAISGGVDSMVMLHLFLWMRRQRVINSFEVVTFNHGIRAEAVEEIVGVEQFCQQHHIKCHSYSLKVERGSNVEQRARQLRYQIFKEFIDHNYWCYLAHHLNDAYEWYLLQLFKSASRCLGIPLVRGGIIRPLMCFSKQHLLQYAKLQEIDYWQDMSNFDCHYERNYIRNRIIPQIEQRFPTYLRHFVFQMNREAARAGKLRGVKQQQQSLLQWDWAELGVALIFPKQCRAITEYREIILERIVRLSQADRGSLMRQLDKLEQAFANNSRGPLSFSGGVDILIYQHGLYIYPQKMQSEIIVTTGQSLQNVNQLWQAPFVSLRNRAVNHRLQAKRLPSWLQQVGQRYQLVSSIELYYQMTYYGRIDENKLINCKFHNIQLI